MSTLTYPEDVEISSATNTLSKKTKPLESFVKNHDISKERINKTNLENYSQTVETKQSIKDNFSNINNLSTRVAEIYTTQAKTINKDNDLYKKLKARVKEKITFLDKALDTYGVIDNIISSNSNKEVQARIYNIISHEIIDEITFSAEEFSKSDQKRLVESAIFYWYVGVERTLFGQEKRVSEFRLRRIFNQKSQ